MKNNRFYVDQEKKKGVQEECKEELPGLYFSFESLQIRHMNLIEIHKTFLTITKKSTKTFLHWNVIIYQQSLKILS